LRDMAKDKEKEKKKFMEKFDIQEDE